GLTGSNSFFVSSLLSGIPEKRHCDFFFPFFSRMSCRRITQGSAPHFPVAKLEKLMLDSSCSRQTRPENAIFILKSSSLRFHRGTENFIAQTCNFHAVFRS
ncbi:unnamed protein product, partial [Sphacelaria rigidula]